LLGVTFIVAQVKDAGERNMRGKMLTNAGCLERGVKNSADSKE